MSADRVVRTCELVLDPEVRENGDLRLRGYAAVFNSPSEDIGFREVILPGAFKRALGDASTDLVMLWQHKSDQPLARQSAKNLRVWEDERGLAFEATLPRTQLAEDALTLTRSGVVRHMSFAFDMQGGTQRTEERNGELWRYVSRVGNLYEISLVTEPAYSSTTVEPRTREALEAIRRHARPKVQGPYGGDSPFSYFRDLALVSEAEMRADAAKGLGSRFEARLLDSGSAHPIHGTIVDAENRLKRSAAEQRALGSMAFDLFSNDGGPGFVGDLFAVAARTRAALASTLAHEPLPKDLHVSIPRFTSGAAVGYQSENLAASNTDPVTAEVRSPVATIAGFVDVYQADLDQTPGALLDRALAQDLGNAFAAMLEGEVIAGDGINNHLLGLLSLVGTSSTTYTDASPTTSEALATVGSMYASTATALGEPIDTIVMHPRRRAWVEFKAGYPVKWLANVVESNGIPTNLGAGTEDAVLALDSDETYLMTSPVRIEAFIEPASGTLSVRFRAYGYAALLAGRQPGSIGKLLGSGLIAPVF